MEPFQPQVLSSAEIHAILTEVSEEDIKYARAHSLTPLKPQILFEGRPGTALVRDTTGKEYIDCTAQAWSLNVGYCNPDVLAAVLEQMRHLTHVRYSYPTIPRIKLIKRLGQLFPGNLTKVVLNNQGGGTAIEAAMKLAMVNKPDATTFLVSYRGYHGASLVTMAATHYMPGLIRFPVFGTDHFIKFPYPCCYRCPIDRKQDTCGLACLEAVEQVIEHGTCAPVADAAQVCIDRRRARAWLVHWSGVSRGSQEQSTGDRTRRGIG